MDDSPKKFPVSDSVNHVNNVTCSSTSTGTTNDLDTTSSPSAIADEGTQIQSWAIAGAAQWPACEAQAISGGAQRPAGEAQAIAGGAQRPAGEAQAVAGGAQRPALTMALMMRQDRRRKSMVLI